MNILKWMKKENSGLARTTLELAKYEALAGHAVCIKQPAENQPIWGVDRGVDLHTIHSQLHPDAYHDGKPKLMFMHGEPISSVSNGISMKAVVDLAPMMDAFICMRDEEYPIWSSLKRTFVIPKGVDLDEFKPLADPTEKLSGEPAVLYYENWRGNRNPLYLCVAMQEVHKVLPGARLHLYNCQDKRMLETFQALIRHNKWWTFVRSLQGPVEDVNALLNKVDIVASCLFPLYARGIEAFAADKAFIGPGYKVDHYPHQCDLDPHSMAQAIIRCWEDYRKVDYRRWAETHHDVRESVRQSIAIYERYL